MADITDIIESVFPSDGSVGIALTNAVQITFTIEMDENTLQDAVILEGPDTDEIIIQPYTPSTIAEGAEDQILETPGLRGVVPGSFTFERISPTTGQVVTTVDETGDGTLYKTRVTFTPSQPLKEDTVYSVFIFGDDDLTDTVDYGVSSRTVFDTVTPSGILSTGSPEFSGTYDGIYPSDTLNVRVTTSGVLGEAKFEWWLDSAVTDLSDEILTHSNELALTNGVNVQFNEGTYQVDDSWSVALKRAVYYENIAKFSFTTGAGSIVPVAGTTATSPTGDPLLIDPTATAFTFVSSNPSDRDAHISPANYKRITVVFSDEVDEDTITDSTVTVTAEPVVDHPNLAITSPDGEVAKKLTVDGKKLYIDI